VAGVTLDTGVFIALERRQRRALALWSEWTRTAATLTVPAVVIAEWWRDRQWDAARWLGGVDVEPVDAALARIAGEVLGELRLGPEHTIDAIVMASAAQRGDKLYTSDFHDMARLATRFPGVRLLAV
jgi:predicted nucleic acid-binding protein